MKMKAKIWSSYDKIAYLCGDDQSLAMQQWDENLLQQEGPKAKAEYREWAAESKYNTTPAAFIEAMAFYSQH
jgi:hypothetical protein